MTTEITISFERFAHLLALEARVEIAVERIINQKYIGLEDVLRILGTEDALREAEKRKQQEMEWNAKHGLAEGSDADV